MVSPVPEKRPASPKEVFRMIRIICSNRYEVLRTCLVENIRAERAGDSPQAVLSDQTVLTPSLSVSDDLRQAFARAFGACTGIVLQFPGDWLGELAGAARTGSDLTRSLVWPVWQVLSDAAFMEQPCCGRLRRYLAHKDECARYDLAQRISEVFRRYVAYRLDWVLAWMAGSPSGRVMSLKCCRSCGPNMLILI